MSNRSDNTAGSSKYSYHTASTSCNSYYSARSLNGSHPATPGNNMVREIGVANRSRFMQAVHEKQLILPQNQELNWSGKGQHVEFEKWEKLPLEAKYVIDHGGTAVVDVVVCRRIKLARKSVRCHRKMTPEMVLIEVKHLQQMRHCHIIQLVGSYLQGTVLAILLYPVADFNLEEFLEYATNETNYGIRMSLRRHCGCLVHALEYIHHKAIKHMDIKPKNVLVKQIPSNPNEYRFYIADFGISRSFAEHSQTDGPTARTLKYCSPETYNQNLRGRSADVFSMGCVLLEIWTVWAMGCALSEIWTVRSGEIFEGFAGYGSDDSYQSYQAILPNVMQWIDHLYYLANLCDSKLKELLFGLETLRKMLEVDPKKRPLAMELKAAFPSNICCDEGPEPYQTDMQKLVEAASGGNQSMVKILLGEACDVNAKVEHGRTALYEASKGGHKTVVRLLLEHKADVKAKDDFGQMALHGAAIAGHEAVVLLLLEHKADVDAKDKSSQTALHIAADRGYEAVVQLLLEHKANVDAKDTFGQTALYEAAAKGDEAVVRLLLEYKADVDARDSLGQTALCKAAYRGYEAVARLLLEYKADVDAKDESGQAALYKTAYKGYEAVARLLLEYKADVNAKDNFGQAALHVAAYFNHEGLVRLLLEHKAEVIQTMTLDKQRCTGQQMPGMR